MYIYIYTLYSIYIYTSIYQIVSITVYTVPLAEKNAPYFMTRHGLLGLRAKLCQHLGILLLA